MRSLTAALEAAEQAAGDGNLHQHGEGDVERSVGDEDGDGAEDGRAGSLAVDGEMAMQQEAECCGDGGGEPQAEDTAGGIVDHTDAVVHGAAEQ